LSDDALLVHIKVIHTETHGACGWPRTWKEFLARRARQGLGGRHHVGFCLGAAQQLMA
jgi:hypothetical protein